MKTCEALASTGASVSLWVTDRSVTKDLEDPFEAYDVKRTFAVERIRVVDALTRAPKFFWKMGYVIERASFYRKVISRLKTVHDATIYTRDPVLAALLLRRTKYPVFWEIHAMPSERVLQKLNGLAGVLSVTRAMANRIRVIFPQMATTVSPDAVDLDVFDPPSSRQDARRELGIREDARLVVYGGRFTTMEQGKGLGMLDEVVARLAEENDAIKLILVGGSAEQFMQVEKRNAAHSTTCVSSVNRTKLALYYRAADVLAMPFPNTPHYAYEMSPLKMFEYMASGTPIVTADLPAIRDVLDEATAVFYEPDNARDLEVKLRSLLSQAAETRSEMGEAAQGQVRQKYTWTKRAQHIADFISR